MWLWFWGYCKKLFLSQLEIWTTCLWMHRMSKRALGYDDWHNGWLLCSFDLCFQTVNLYSLAGRRNALHRDWKETEASSGFHCLLSGINWKSAFSFFYCLTFAAWWFVKALHKLLSFVILPSKAICQHNKDLSSLFSWGWSFLVSFNRSKLVFFTHCIFHTAYWDSYSVGDVFIFLVTQFSASSVEIEFVVLLC